MEVPDWQEVWVNQLEVVDLQRQDVSSDKSAHVRRNRKLRRDYELNDRSDSTAGNTSSRVGRGSVLEGHEGTSRQQTRSNSDRAALYNEFMIDNNRRGSRKNRTEHRYSPETELSKVYVVSNVDGHRVDSLPAFRGRQPNSGVLPSGRRFNTGLDKERGQVMSHCDDVYGKGAYYPAGSKSSTTKSRRASHGTLLDCEQLSEPRYSDLSYGGRKFKEVMNQGDNLPEKDSQKRYYQTSNQRESYSAPDFTKSRLNRKVKNPVTDEGPYIFTTTKQIKPKESHRQPRLQSNTSKVVFTVHRNGVGRHSSTSAPFETEEGRTLQSRYSELSKKARRQKNSVLSEVVSKAQATREKTSRVPVKDNFTSAQSRTTVVEVTMMADVSAKKASGKGVEEKKEAPIWNLKGRSIDDILVDLEAIKNDPTAPMPTIEADPVTVSEFQQYIDDAKVKEAEGIVVENEKENDSLSLQYLRQTSGMGFGDERPQAFPLDLWSYVLHPQKHLVKERWMGYDEERLPQEVSRLLAELQISEERPYAVKYFQAQALANLDRYVVKGTDGVPPLIHEKYTHKMELMPGTRPRKELPQRFSENQNAFLKAKLDILERQGRIMQKEGLSKEDWLHRLVLVEYPARMAAFRLKHGVNTQEAMMDPANAYEVSQLFRLCIDCREINKCLAIEPYPMPEITIGKENIVGSRYLTTTDAADAFFAVPLREEDYGKTGFTALGKQWVFKVMLQGGINSARHFARIIMETFDGVPHSRICPFQDDALCHGKNLREILENQQLMYDRFRTSEIQLKPSKTKIGFSTCRFLGHIYTPMGRLPDPARVECIISMDTKPKTQKEVRHIVGLLVWNIEYIPNGMAILSNLTDLIRKDVDVESAWKEEVHGRAIDQLKAALVSAPCLKPIDCSRPFRVHVDACKNGRGIGAVLLQEYNGKWRPCAYYSKALTPAQRQWSATELEAYALVSAARHWARYLQNGHMWTAIVDHKALIYLVVKRTKTSNTRLLNSVMSLQDHHFDILHRNGEEHFDADAVSRILHSGDIELARNAYDKDEDLNRVVTLRDIELLNKMLELQVAQLKSPALEFSKADGGEKSVEVKTEIASENKAPETTVDVEAEGLIDTVADKTKVEEITEHVSVSEAWNFQKARGTVVLESVANRDLGRIRETLPDPPDQTTRQGSQHAITEETNMANADRGSRLMARQQARESLLEAQKKAREDRARFARERKERNSLSNTASPATNGETTMDSSDSQSSLFPDLGTGNGEDEEDDNKEVEGEDSEDYDDPVGQEEVTEEELERDVIMVETGPHRWTKATMSDYMRQYKPMVGKLWIHPRNRRLYEVTTVFFYAKEKVAAAYSRVMDGGPSDVIDKFPMRFDGKGGLTELIAEFDRYGGSLGVSKTPWPLSNEEWAKLQEDDLYFGPVITEMKEELETIVAEVANGDEHENEDPEPPKVFRRANRKVLVYDGILYAAVDNRDINGALQYVVPKSLQQNVLELYHDSRGHPGTNRLRDTILLHYWWPGMSDDIEEYCRNCKACARRKARYASAKVPIQAYEAPALPWDRAHIDLTGPFEPSKQGNKYIVVVKDALTRYVETMAIKNKTAEEVVAAFIQLMIYRHGCVRQLVSDDGREFDNKLFAQVAQLLRIRHSIICPYNPRANGLAENHMRTMKDALGIYCDESQEDWDEHLRGVTMSYNITVNSQTGYTPYFMMFGREAVMPSEAWMTQFVKSRGIRDYVKNIIDALTKAWEEAAESKPKEVQKMKADQHPVGHREYRVYNEGDYAMVEVKPISTAVGWVEGESRTLTHKLQPRFAGPYQIIKRKSPVVYVLLIDGVETPTHAINMKPYKGAKNILTQYIEPGYTRSEAAAGIAKEPLLLSPNPGYNQLARVRYLPRNPNAERVTTELRNAEEARVDRHTETLQRLSQSQISQEMLVLDESLPEAEDENGEHIQRDEVIEDEDSSPSLVEQISVIPEAMSSPQVITLATDDSISVLLEMADRLKQEDDRDDHAEVNLAEVTDSWAVSDGAEIKAVRNDNKFKKGASIIGASWEQSVRTSLVAKRTRRQQILDAAGIKSEELNVDPSRKNRIESWIREISADECQRVSQLSKKRSHVESGIATLSELIGWKVREREIEWYRSPFNNPSRLVRPGSSGSTTRTDSSVRTRSQSPLALFHSPMGTDLTIIKMGAPSKKAKSLLQTPIEETNYALAQMCTEEVSEDSSKTSSLVEDNFNIGEDIDDREQWHRSLLKAYARQLNWCLDGYNGPAALVKNGDQKLRVELDKCIPVDLGTRRLWYELQKEIRDFAETGLLIPARNFSIPEGERWKNYSTKRLRKVTARVQNYLAEILRLSTSDAMLAKRMRRLLPNVEDRVILRHVHTDWKCKRCLYENEELIRDMADKWYWKLLLRAEVVVPDRRPNSIAKVRVKYHRSEVPFNRPQKLLQSHLFYLMDAIERNRLLSEPPKRLAESTYWC